MGKMLLVMGSLVRFLLLLFLSFILTFSWSNVPWNQVMAVSPVLLEQEQQGRKWYQQGEINRAIETWLNTIEDYEKQGEIVAQGRVLSYLALAYSYLGQWQQADSSINKSLDLLQSQPENNKVLPILAEAFNIQGTLFLGRGNPLAALSSWEQSTATYEKVQDTSGVLRTNINQARALQSLGLYTKACQKLSENLIDNSLECDQLNLEKINPYLSNDLTSLQQAGWLSLGQILRQQGNLGTSELILNKILDQVYSQETKASILLNIGQGLQLQNDIEGAKDSYQQAIIAASNVETRLKIQLNKLNLLITENSWIEAQELLIDIENIILQLPLSKTKVGSQIYLANLLLKWSNLGTASDLLPSWTKVQNLLENAQKDAEIINYEKEIIYALGDLGKLYEKLAINKACQNNNNLVSDLYNCENNHQFSDSNQINLSSNFLNNQAKKFTEQALIKAQSKQIPNTTYVLQWQLGRILYRLDFKKEAIAAYLEAVRSLQILTVDLANNRDNQFSFQEKVDPVYRELLSLLLPNNNQTIVSQQTLEQARQQIEALQVAQINNFFNDICVENEPVDVAEIDPTAAIIYPIILSDRLAVLVSLPDKSLAFHTTKITQKELEKQVKQFRYNIVIRSQRAFFDDGKVLYEWLIEPFRETLEEFKIETLVFVSDGVFRNAPMGALYDGQKYLIENYKVAVSPGLTLLSPKPLQNRGLKTLFGGLTETFEQEKFVPLFYVQQELKSIQRKVPNTALLNEDFTLNNLEKVLKNQSFPIVHFATHGQFSSDFEQTFIVAWDSYINVLQLEKLLKENDPRGSNPIELLILSACETASGDSRAALGLAGFAVRAGARSTLATLWSVNDQAAAVIMEQFYKELSTNKLSKAEALRKAQSTMLKNRWYRHPFYWSAYTLVGNWL
ncbi:MAG: CHAT domain-containing protein [Crocosphaera sp.]|uniref:CHAT domain-containing protein n=1 Tax=Crocosphaera sp. TaxID=2729996 RepID=UPI00258322D6|nr:CHAT domain-containing protein [Crocosphaera sp.]MCH2245183.1 CHAT domain-containing protein [Crocosphaera sp.]